MSSAAATAAARSSQQQNDNKSQAFQLLQGILQRANIESSINKQDLERIALELQNSRSTLPSPSIVGPSGGDSSTEDEDDQYSYVTATPSPRADDGHSYLTVTTPSLSEVTLGSGSPGLLLSDDTATPRPLRSRKHRKQSNHSPKQEQMLILQLQQKQIELDQTRREFQLKIVRLEEDKEQERHAAELERISLLAKLKSYEKSLKEVKQRTDQEFDAVKKNVDALEREKKSLAEQIDSIKREFLANGLHTLSDEQYVMLKRVHVDQQTLVQFVQCFVYERLKESLRTGDELRHENTVLNENLKRNASTLERLKRENEHLKRSSSDMEHDLREQIGHLESKAQRLEEALRDAQMRWEQYQGKNDLFDQLKKKLDDSNAMLLERENQVSLLDRQLSVAAEEKQQFQAQFSSQQQQIELLTKDKLYLTKDSQTLSVQLETAKTELEAASKQIEQLKRQKESVQDQLLQITVRTKTESVQEREEAIQKLRDQTKKDLEKIKKNAYEAYEREVRVLRESKQAAQEEKEKIHAQLTELRQEHDLLATEHRTLQATAERQLSEIRSQLKLKVFENERLTASQLESTNNMNGLKNELSVLNKKLEVIRTAYYSLQTDSAKRITELETRLESTGKELQGYRDLEEELDKAVESSAALFLQEDDDDAPGYGYDAAHDMSLEDVSQGHAKRATRIASAETLARIPTNATRRLKYSLYLARKVSALDKTIADLKSMVKRKDQDVGSLSEQLKRCQAKLEKTTQPYNYLVSTIDSRERDIRKKDSHISALEKDLRQAQRELKQAKKECEVFQEDLTRLLQQNQQLQQLKSVLSALRQQMKDQQPVPLRPAPLRSVLKKTSSVSNF